MWLKHLGGEAGKKQRESVNAHLRKLLAEGKIDENKLRSMLRPLEDSEPFRVESTTTYSPAVNVQIADDLFDFTPPA
jgi:hypothetical protein